MIAVCVTFYAIGNMAGVEHSGWWSWISARKGDAAHTSIVLCGMIVTLLFFDNAKPVADKIRFLNAIAFCSGFIYSRLFLATLF